MLTAWQIGWMAAQDGVTDGVWLKLHDYTECLTGWLDAKRDEHEATEATTQLSLS